MTTTDDLVALRKTGNADRVYAFGEVPTLASLPYLVIANGPGAPEVRPLAGPAEQTGGFTVQHFSRTDDLLDEITARSTAAFEGRALPLPGSPVAQQVMVTKPYRDPDTQGVLSVLHTYRY